MAAAVIDAHPHPPPPALSHPSASDVADVTLTGSFAVSHDAATSSGALSTPTRGIKRKTPPSPSSNSESHSHPSTSSPPHSSALPAIQVPSVPAVPLDPAFAISQTSPPPTSSPSAINPASHPPPQSPVQPPTPASAQELAAHLAATHPSIAAHLPALASQLGMHLPPGYPYPPTTPTTAAPVPGPSTHPQHYPLTTTSQSPMYDPTSPTSPSSSDEAGPSGGGGAGSATGSGHVLVTPGAEILDTPGGGKRPLAASKRAEQNRKAQRAFRERRDQHVKTLESRSQLLDAALASADEANRRWEECRAVVDALRIESAQLRAEVAGLRAENASLHSALLKGGGVGGHGLDVYLKEPGGSGDGDGRKK